MGIPLVALLVLVFGSFFVYVSQATTTIVEDFMQSRIETAMRSVQAHLEAHERRTLMAATAMSSAELVHLIEQWDRLAIWEYIVERKTMLEVDAIIIADHEGTIMARSHYRDFYGDNVTLVPGRLRGLLGEYLTFYTATPTAPMVMTTSAPILDGSRIVGTVIVNIDIGTNDFVEYFQEMFGIDVTVFAGNTSVASTLIHPTTGARAVGTQVAQHVAATVLERGESMLLDLNIFGLLPYTAYYFPLLGPYDNPLGMFFIGVSREESHAVASAMQRSILIIGSASLAVLVVVMLILIMRTLKPIILLTRTLDETANGDLTRRLPEVGKDEVAKASRSFNKTMQELSTMIAEIKRQAGALSGIGGDLAGKMEQTVSAINGIVGTMSNIKSQVLTQSASVIETSATMEQVTANIGRLNGSVEAQANAVSQSSTAIEEMIANIRSVTETLAKNAENIIGLQESAETGKSSLQEVVHDINEIARESEGLMEINSVMENIASQTNLLSMNAAIEAAHAGDAGKGFAVVADEIRKLAESSSEQSKTISEVLKKIKGAIDKITLSTANVLDKFDTIDQRVKVVTAQEEIVRSAMAEQSQGSRQILGAASQVSEITQQVKDGSHEMLEGSKGVIQESKNLEKATQEITQGMSAMTIGADQVTDAVGVANDLSAKTKENISALVQSVSRFKV